MNERGALLPTNLPADLGAELRQCGRYNLDNAKFALYALVDLKEADLQKICTMVKRIFTQDVLQLPESEVDDFLFPAPGWSSLAQRNISEILDYHIRHLDKGWRNCEGSNEGELQWWPFELVVVASKSWQSDGLILVHCEYDSQSGLITVESCRMEVKNIGLSLTSLRNSDDSFGNIKNQFGYKSVI